MIPDFSDPCEDVNKNQALQGLLNWVLLSWLEQKL